MGRITELFKRPKAQAPLLVQSSALAECYDEIRLDPVEKPVDRLKEMEARGKGLLRQAAFEQQVAELHRRLEEPGASPVPLTPVVIVTTNGLEVGQPL